MSDEEDRQEDKKKSEPQIGMGTFMNFMQADQEKDKSAMKDMFEIKEEMIKFVIQEFEKARIHTTKVDRSHHERREEMQKGITKLETKIAVAEAQLQALQDEGETIFDENGKPLVWYLQPKTWKSFAKGIAAVILILASAWAAVSMQNGDDEPKDPSATEAPEETTGSE